MVICCKGKNDDKHGRSESLASESSDGSDEDTKRGNWSNPLDFLLSLIGYAVGLGNIWRFPYLCMRNGGGAFLIPYFTFLFLCGMPLFYMEVCLGQFSSLSALYVWKLAPLFKGLGWAMLIVSGICCIYYNVIITWVLYYLFRSFTTELPWGSCGNPWNTPLCIDRSALNLSAVLDNSGNWTAAYLKEQVHKAALMAYSSHHPNMSGLIGAGGEGFVVDLELGVVVSADGGNDTEIKWKSPAEEFWQNEVLQLSPGIHDMGGIRWQLVLFLILSWVLIFLCLFKGVKSLGKVVYVTATAPYVFLVILLIRGLTLDGALDGVKFYLSADWSRLYEFKVWGEACLQIFYTLGPAWGGLITMASYNRFHNNALRDSIIVCLTCCGTSFFAGFVIYSIIGFMAKETSMPIQEVITAGPGLAFVAYPEALNKLPISPLWAVSFFLMLLTVGLDSQFGMVETVSSGFIDLYPNLLQKRKSLFVAFMCAVMCIFGLPFVCRGGMYVFQIFDWYSASFSCMVIALCEIIALMALYGVRRFSYDVEMMQGSPPNIWFKICWCCITPTILVVILVFSSFQMSAPTYGDYEYPGWAIVIGWCLAMCSIVPIPCVALFMIIKSNGSLIDRLRHLTQPEKDWGPALEKHRAQYKYSQVPMKELQPGNPLVEKV